MNVPGAIFSFTNLRLSEIQATKRTNQTFFFTAKETSEDTYSHDQKNNLYLCFSTSGSSSVQEKKTVRDACLSIHASSNRTCTFIVVPYV